MGHALPAQQITAVLIMAFVILLLLVGRFRFDAVALCGLVIAAALRVAPAAIIVSGFRSPALYTIGAILVISEGITESRLFSGLGRAIEGALSKQEHQIIGLTLVTSLLSSFMNNVGALSTTLPTAVRMAGRSRSSPGTYVMPMVYGAILGGTITLVGSAPNIIVSAYRAEALGRPYGMFDFAPHGMALVITGVLLWLTCHLCGFSLDRESSVKESTIVDETEADDFPRDILSTTAKRITLFTVLPSLVLVSVGVLPAQVAFGAAAVALLVTGVLHPVVAYQKVDLSLLVFVGSMLGLARVLEHTGAMGTITRGITRVSAALPPLLFVAAVFLVSSFLSSILNNTAAAALMAPLVIDLATTISPDALLMAVAAGSCLSMILPTHHATVMAMGQAPFSPALFARNGAVLTLACAGVGSALILVLWGGG